MLLNIAIAIFIMVITTIIHAGGMVFVMHNIQKIDQLQKQDGFRRHQSLTHIYWIGGTILWMFMVSLLEVVVWAITFQILNAIKEFEEALYFSMVTFATLGYGDVLLEERWRLLGSFEAANGIIMFGWTTAIVLAVIQHVYYGGKQE